MGFKLEWYGHSYMVLECSNTRIAVDPHDGGSLNLPEYRVNADYALISHNHFDHNAVEMLNLPSKDRIVKWRKGEYTLGGARITAVELPHDPMGGSLRGKTVAYRIECGDIIFSYLGDIGDPEPEGLDLFEASDVLAVPVGGTYTINAYQAWSIVERLKPRIVLPVHYWIEKSTLPLDPLDLFLNIAKIGRTRIENNRIELEGKESLPPKPTIAILRLPRA